MQVEDRSGKQGEGKSGKRMKNGEGGRKENVLERVENGAEKRSIGEGS